MFGIDDAVMGGLISGGLSLIGGERRNAAQADQASAANAFSAQQFATRYQTTVKDMEAAGLNPMLAYSQGGGSPPSGQQAQVQDTFSPAVESFNRTRSTGAQNAVQNATVRNVDADTKNKEATTANIEADTALKRANMYLSQAQTDTAGASASLSRAQIGFLEVQSKKIVEEIKNIPKEGNRLDALVKNLAVEYDNILARTHNVKTATDQLRWLAVKTMLEGDLLTLDVKAATDLSNLGRYAKEGKIVLDILREIRRK